jgi:hypothetical protein
MTAYKEGFLNGVPKESGFELIKESLSNNRTSDRPPFLNCELAEKPKLDNFVFAEVHKRINIRLDSG